jgi:UDP-N-acetylglucosamine 2-epimerase (non-hydrolysing)
MEENSKVLISGHPRFLSYFNKSAHTLSQKVKLCEPFAYVDFLYLQTNAKCVVSDSGSLSEEAAILGFRAISLRDSTERPEAIEVGSVILSGTSSIGFTQSLEMTLHSPQSKCVPPEYQIEDTSARVVSFIQSTVHQSKFWSGLR